MQRGRRPNLLFLIADDHAGYVLGADGNRLARTPAFDSLAAGGVRFARHYCNAPVCTASRQSLLTGQMPHTAGVTQLRTALSTGKPTLARQLKQAGYQTATFGKMHFNRKGESGLHGFDVCQTEDIMAQRWRAEVKAEPAPESTPVQKLPWQPFRTHAREWLNASALPYPRRDEEMRGTFIARQAMRYLEENRDRQFALWVSLQEPHSPFDFPLEDRGKFDPKVFAVQPPGPEDGWQVPTIFEDLTQEEKQGSCAAYYTSAHFLDRNMGRVLAKLRELRLEENTLVVYTADHGYCLGQHGRFEKHCGYDPALRVPLILSQPGRLKPGVVDHFTEHIDLGPTLLRLLDAPAFSLQHGQDLWKARTSIVSEYQENEEIYVRTSRWKLIYGSGRRERQDGYLTAKPTPGRYTRLFDLESDPGEYRNVAAANAGVVQELGRMALARLRQDHPDRAKEPSRGNWESQLDFYLQPRDNAPPAEARP
jgi:choline-sulfatase